MNKSAYKDSCNPVVFLQYYAVFAGRQPACVRWAAGTSAISNEEYGAYL